MRLLLSLTLAASLLTGCGGEAAPNREPVYPISGRVTYKGKPVVAADVTFQCAEKNRSAFGRTDDDGKFELSTFSSNDGAVAGTHIVMVTKIDAPPPTQPAADISSANYEPPKIGASTEPVKPKNSIPIKYGDAKTTPVKAIVNDDGNNAEVIIELKD